MRAPVRSALLEVRAEASQPVEGQSDNGVLIALAGSPNVGKSTVFNLLTGLSQHVGNWSGKTVEQKSGTCQYGARALQIVDLPGTYSLTANSAEEQIARDFIIKERPRVVVAILNAASLERNLYLVAELLELPSPVVIGLNMMDVATGQGMRVEEDVLQAALGIPVVPLVAGQSREPQALLAAVEGVLEESFPYRPRRPAWGHDLLGLTAQIEALLDERALDPYPRQWLATKLLEGDRELTSLVQSCLPADRWKTLETLLGRHEDAVISIASARYAWVERMVRAAVIRPGPGVVSLTERLDRVATHLYLGPAVLLSVMALIFWLVYQVGGPMAELLNLGVSGAAGFVAQALFGAPTWLVRLISDGLLGGVGTVLALLPILAIFFLALGLLEDVGYMSRAAFVTDRFMHWMGLHGKSFFPLFLGFGCNVPAVLGTRIVESERARLLTILLAPLVPCSGRMAVLVFLTGAFFGSSAPIVAWGLMAFSLVAVGLSGAVINRLVFHGESPAFIMELPLYHRPNWRTIALQTWQRLVGFVTRAGTVILAVSAIVWLLGTLPSGQIESSYLAQVGGILAPVGNLMGLDWRMMVALLTSFVAKENTVATLAVLTGSEGTSLAAGLSHILSPAAGLALLVTQMLFVPCVATVAAIRQETRSWGWTGFSVLYQLVLSFVAGVAIYQAALWLHLGV